MSKFCSRCGAAVNDEKKCPQCGLEQTTSDVPKQSETAFEARKKEILYLVINTVVMLPILIGNPSVLGTTIVLGLGAVMCSLIIIRSKPDGFAGSNLAFIVFLDIFMLIGIFWEGLHKSEPPEYSVSISGIVGWMLLILLGIIFLILCHIKFSRFELLTWFSYEVIATGVIYLYYSGKDNAELILRREGVMLLIAYTAISLMWFTVARISVMLAPQKQLSIRGMNLVLFVVFFLFCSTQTGRTAAYMRDLPASYTSFAEKHLPWYWILIFTVIAVAGAYTLEKKKQRKCGADSMILLGIAGFVLVQKASIVYYFTYNWSFLLLYAFIFLYYLENERSGKQRFRLHNGYVHIIFTAALILSMMLIAKGLWLNVAVTLVFGFFILPNLKGHGATGYWCTTLLGITCEAIAWSWQFCNSISNIGVLLWIFLFAVITMLIVTWPHPARQMYKKGVPFVICGALLLLLLIPAQRKGTSIRLTQEGDTDTVTITALAKGKNNSITKLSYYWNDGKRKVLVKKTDKKKGLPQKQIKVKGECLTVIAVDKNGIQTTKNMWFPYTFHNMR